MGLFGKTDRAIERTGSYATFLEYLLRYGVPVVSAAFTVGSPLLPWWRHVQYLAAQEGLIVYPVILLMLLGAFYILFSCVKWAALRLIGWWIKSEITRPLTRFRIRLAGDGTAIEELTQNVVWQQTIANFETTPVDPKNGGTVRVFRVDTISCAFPVPVEYERPEVNTFGHNAQLVGSYSLGIYGHVLMFKDGLPPLMDVLFPPIGYYADRTKAALDEEGNEQVRPTSKGDAD
ncbi:MAG: hypothetical protein KDJ80_01950 [Nitratireductor sp.]|nr:hypothetical protein [Nitratireductor sp.]